MLQVLHKKEEEKESHETYALLQGSAKKCLVLLIWAFQNRMLLDVFRGHLIGNW